MAVNSKCVMTCAGQRTDLGPDGVYRLVPAHDLCVNCKNVIESPVFKLKIAFTPSQSQFASMTETAGGSITS